VNGDGARALRLRASLGGEADDAQAVAAPATVKL
jgi:hypothetical protein